MNTTKIAKDILARKIRAMYPDAKTYCLTPTGRREGYRLIGVIMSDDSTTVTLDSGHFEEFSNSASRYVEDMPQGAFGEDREADYFDVDMSTGQIIR